MTPVDLADEAQQRIEEERAEGVRKIVVAMAGQGLVDCEGCGSEIEAARRRAHPGARRCLNCQEAAERRRRQYRGG